MMSILDARSVMAMAALCAVSVFRSGDAISCYVCSSAVGTACNPFNANGTSLITIGNCSTCLTTIVAGVVGRSCAPSVTIASGCTGIGSVAICNYNCTTNLCNTMNKSRDLRYSDVTLAAVLLFSLFSLVKRITV